jgi:hypothetical protein
MLQVLLVFQDMLQVLLKLVLHLLKLLQVPDMLQVLLVFQDMLQVQECLVISMQELMLVKEGMLLNLLCQGFRP